MSEELESEYEDRFGELRRRAEQFLSEGTSPNGELISLKDAQKLVTELQIHQIELEMQNDELRKTQGQLASERERYADLYNFAPAAYFIFDERDIIIDLNLAAAVLLSNERKFLLDHPITPYITPDSLGVFITHRELALRTGAPQYCELIVRLRDGVHIYVHVQTVALSLSNGESHRWRSVMTNITDQKKAGEMIRRLSRAVEQSPASILITDTAGNIEYVNPRFTQVTGYTVEEVLGGNPRMLKSEQTPAETYQDLWRTISMGREWMGEFANKKKNGELYYELANISPITDDKGVITHYMAINEDITERKFIAEALQESNLRLLTTLNALPDLMFEMTRKGVVRNFHAARTEMLHAQPRDFMNKDIEKSMPADAARIIKSALAEAAISGTSSGAVYSLEQAEGVVWYELSITAKGDPHLLETNFIVLSRDITDRKLAEKKLQMANNNLHDRLLEIETLQARLREQAMRDHLTGLYNRHYLKETLDREIARALRNKQSVSIMIMDVDHFKRVNDSYGHRVGDLVLRALGDLLKSNIRAGDIPCRYGGEEFIIVMPDVPLSTAHERAVHISAKINELQVPHEDMHLQVSVSVGVASIPQHGLNGEDVLLRADRALYRAKELGRNRIVLYEEGINPDTLRM